MIRIITNVALDSLQSFTVDVSDDDVGIRSGSVRVPKDTPAQRVKRQAVRALSHFQWKKTRRRVSILMAADRRNLIR